MNIDHKLAHIKSMLKKIRNYDVETFVDELDKWIYEISYFYNVIVKDGQNPSDIPYKIKPSKRPDEGQIAYFNLRRGYPKETFDDHWCYILKDFGNKYVVIPTTSVKPDSCACNDKYEMDIKIKDFTNNSMSRLQITDIRTVDTMRVCQSIEPNFYDVETDKNTIINKVKSVIFI